MIFASHANRRDVVDFVGLRDGHGGGAVARTAPFGLADARVRCMRIGGRRAAGEQFENAAQPMNKTLDSWA